MSLVSTFAAARSLATVGSVQTREQYSLWPPRNPLIAHNFSVASVLLVDSQNFATPQESSLQPRSMSVVELVSDLRAPLWKRAAVTGALTHLSLLTN